MKKLLLLLFVSIFTISCSSDDDTSSQDPIIGTWYLFAVDDIEVDECRKQTTTIFNSNGTSTQVRYSLNNSGDCESSPQVNATWTNQGNNIYEIIPDTQTNDTTFEVIFSDNNNTLEAGDTTYKRK